MKIVGGTYEERVVEPDSADLMGSGVRAAAILANVDQPPLLITAIHSAAEDESRFVWDALSVRTENVRQRNERVAFSYMTPIAPPSVTGPRATLVDRSPIEVDDDDVLAFGMVEVPQQSLQIAARTLVYDPQQPRDLDSVGVDNVSADRFVLVANESETRLLGFARDVVDAAARVLKRYPSVDSLVTKRGAAGCIVFSRDALPEFVGAHPTMRVWPIGSGDAFTAGLANALRNGADMVEAARIGSAVAATWCSTRSTSIPRQVLDGDPSALPLPLAPVANRIYLAGPFFNVSERWLVEVVRDELRALGSSPWSPIDEVGRGGLEVAQKDLDGLLECDSVLALLDHEDPGTVFEVGWAVRHGIPVIGYGTNINNDGTKMMAGTAVELHEDLSTACYRAVWAGMGMPIVSGRHR